MKAVGREGQILGAAPESEADGPGAGPSSSVSACFSEAFPSDGEWVSV